MATKFSQRYYTTTSTAETPFGTTVNRSSYSSALGGEDSKSGVSNPGWKSMVARHVGATTGFSASRTEVHYSPTVIKNNYDPHVFGGPSNQWIFSTSEGVVIDPTDYLRGFRSLDLSNVQRLALQRIYANIRSVRSSFSGGVFLGELRETLQLIKHPAQALRRSLDSYATRAYKRVRSVKGFPRGSGVVPPSARRQVAKVLQDTWLEYSLGVTPLISDIQSGYNTLRKKGKAFAQGDAIDVRGESQDSTVTSNPWQSAIVGKDTFQPRAVDRAFGTVRYSGAVWGYPFGRSLEDKTLWGLDNSQFFPTLWEIMPYSFIVDYFINVGDVLDAWSMGAVQMAWSQLTVRQFSEAIRTDWRVIQHDPWTVSNQINQGQLMVRKRLVSRTNLGTQLDLPTLIFKLPTHIGQAFNLSALFNLRGVKASRYPSY